MRLAVTLATVALAAATLGVSAPHRKRLQWTDPII